MAFPSVELVTDDASLAALAVAVASSPRVAVDVEADGLHAFRPKLCVMQLAFVDAEGASRVALIDTLAVNLAPLAPMLAEGGPIKIFHDLTFDAKMLDEAGLSLGRARDTSVAARLLGCPATGLGSLLEAELGVKVDKRFQQHDWAARPLTTEQLAYLANDVAYLAALDDHLSERVATADLTEEVAEECAYKLATALAPPRDRRPAYVRVKGSAALDGPGRAVLRRLVDARDRTAERLDVPAFKVIGADVLLALARQRPRTSTELRAVRGAAVGRAARATAAMLEAIAFGLEDGDVPEADRPFFEPMRPDRAAIARYRTCEARVTGWRRAEAKRRGIDEQAVLPGHCAQEVTEALLAHGDDESALRATITAIFGFGAKRALRYLDALTALGAVAPSAAALSPNELG